MRKVLLGVFCLGLAAWSIGSKGTFRDSQPKGHSSREELLMAFAAQACAREERFAGLQCPDPAAPVPYSEKELSRNVARALRDIGKLDTPDALADAAFLRILSGHEEKALLLLQQAIKLDPRRADLWNDLAVAHLSRSRRRGEPYDLIHALSPVDEALVRSSSAPESRFNRALVLTKLGLARRARLAWRDYLAMDRNSRWSEAARVNWFSLAPTDLAEKWEFERLRLHNLAHAGDQYFVRSLVRRFPQRSRLHAEEELFPGWAKAVKVGNKTEAVRIARLLRSLGNGLSAEAGDRLIAESVDAIQEASSEELARLAEGHLHYEQGRAAYQRRDLQAAKTSFAEARRAFAALTPFAEWASFHTAVLDYHERSYDTAIDLAQALRRRAAADSFLVLGGRVEWLLGLIEHEKGAPSQAIEHFNEAIRLFERAREPENAAQVHARSASAFEYMGEPHEAWRHRYLALKGTRESGEKRRLPAVLGEAALAASKTGLYSVALAFQDEAVDVALGMRDVLAISEAYWWKGVILQRSGRLREASRNAALARNHCARIPNETLRLHTLAGIEGLEGAILKFRDPAAAVNSLSAALEYCLQREFRYSLLEIYLHRGQAFAALGDRDRARTDFLSGVSEYEWQRKSIDDIGLRLTYFEQAQKVFDELVNLELQQHENLERAFDVAERAKARVLWDALGSSYFEREPLTMREVQTYLPPDTTLVSYYVRDGEILAWKLSPQGMEGVSIAVPRRELEEKVTSYRRAILSDDEPQARRLATALYKDLLGSFKVPLPPTHRIVFIPDGDLHSLPFSALVEPLNQRFLLQDHAVSVAPSASAYLWAIEQAKAIRKTRQPTALAVGDPAFCHEKHKGLTRLPWAASEARQAASLFPGSVLLTGNIATPERFLEEVGRHDLIVYSGHVMANIKMPFLSKLLLAHSNSERKSGELSAREIYSLHLRRPLLVVLSACETARSLEENLEGGTDMARSFLAAGVPSVVATLWNVDDREADAFFSIFYNLLKEREDAVSALRAAQLDQLSQEDGSKSARIWAGFQLVGASPQINSAGQ